MIPRGSRGRTAARVRHNRVFMSGLSLPVNRPTGRALLVAGAGSRAGALELLRDLGFGATEIDDPYAAMAELCRRPLVYRAVILSLASLYREELSMIPAVKSRFPHLEVWLAQTDGRQAALAEGMRLGADGLLAEDGLHRVAHTATPGPAGPGPMAGATAGAAGLRPAPAERSADDGNSPAGAAEPWPPRHQGDEDHDADGGFEDGSSATDVGPVLTPDELRALLQEQSPVPPDEA
jgi:hypothetical protein